MGTPIYSATDPAIVALAQQHSAQTGIPAWVYLSLIDHEAVDSTAGRFNMFGTGSARGNSPDPETQFSDEDKYLLGQPGPINGPPGIAQATQRLISGQETPAQYFLDLANNGYEGQEQGKTLEQSRIDWANEMANTTYPKFSNTPAGTAGGGGVAQTSYDPNAVGPDGRTVAQITGTSYKSDAERDWYFQQTTGHGAPAAGNTGVQNNVSPDGHTMDYIRQNGYADDAERAWFLNNVVASGQQISADARSFLDAYNNANGAQGGARGSASFTGGGKMGAPPPPGGGQITPPSFAGEAGLQAQQPAAPPPPPSWGDQNVFVRQADGSLVNALGEQMQAPQDVGSQTTPDNTTAQGVGDINTGYGQAEAVLRDQQLQAAQQANGVGLNGGGVVGTGGGTAEQAMAAQQARRGLNQPQQVQNPGETGIKLPTGFDFFNSPMVHDRILGQQTNALEAWWRHTLTQAIGQGDLAPLGIMPEHLNTVGIQPPTGEFSMDTAQAAGVQVPGAGGGNQITATPGGGSTGAPPTAAPPTATGPGGGVVAAAGGGAKQPPTSAFGVPTQLGSAGTTGAPTAGVTAGQQSAAAGGTASVLAPSASLGGFQPNPMRFARAYQQFNGGQPVPRPTRFNRVGANEAAGGVNIGAGQYGTTS